jgi:hypothetical protein
MKDRETVLRVLHFYAFVYKWGNRQNQKAAVYQYEKYKLTK